MQYLRSSVLKVRRQSPGGPASSPAGARWRWPIVKPLLGLELPGKTKPARSGGPAGHPLRQRRLRRFACYLASLLLVPVPGLP